MGKRIPDDLDRRRGQPPRNGTHLSAGTRSHLEVWVASLTRELCEHADQLRHGRIALGDRAWRRENLTAEQRSAIRQATKRVRAEAKKWLK